MGKFLTCETHQGLMDIYVSLPDSKNRSPVVIVLQEAFGVNHHIQSICDRLAEEGFVAAAPELYHRQGRHVEVSYETPQEMKPHLSQLTNQNIIQDVRTTINFLEDLSLADTQHVSTLGFCVGGFSSVLCATKLNIKKMVSFYGAGLVHEREGLALTPLLDEVSLIKSKCLFFFGGKDSSISSEEITALETKMTGAKIRYDVVIFEKASHGFFCDERKFYDPEAANVSWKKTLAFLKD